MSARNQTSQALSKQRLFPTGRHGLVGAFYSMELRRHTCSLFRSPEKSFANASEFFGTVR